MHRKKICLNPGPTVIRCCLMACALVVTSGCKRTRHISNEWTANCDSETFYQIEFQSDDQDRTVGVVTSSSGSPASVYVVLTDDVVAALRALKIKNRPTKLLASK